MERFFEELLDQKYLLAEFLECGDRKRRRHNGKLHNCVWGDRTEVNEFYYFLPRPRRKADP